MKEQLIELQPGYTQHPLLSIGILRSLPLRSGPYGCDPRANRRSPIGEFQFLSLQTGGILFTALLTRCVVTNPPRERSSEVRRAEASGYAKAELHPAL